MRPANVATDSVPNRIADSDRSTNVDSSPATFSDSNDNTPSVVGADVSPSYLRALGVAAIEAVTTFVDAAGSSHAHAIANRYGAAANAFTKPRANGYVVTDAKRKRITDELSDAAIAIRDSKVGTADGLTDRICAILAEPD